MSCPALLSLSLGHHFDNLALKSPTGIDHIGCWLLRLESTNVSDKQMMSMLFALINASIKGTLTKS